MQDRLGQLERWLKEACGLKEFLLTPASEDASFRRYFRVERAGQASLIAMDAPPDKEDCRPFVAIARRLSAAGLHVPALYAEDLEQGRQDGLDDAMLDRLALNDDRIDAMVEGLRQIAALPDPIGAITDLD